DRLDLLGHRRVHDQPVRGIFLDAQLGDVVRLGRVVLLVEDRGAAVGGRAQPPEPGDERQQHDHAGDDQVAGGLDGTGVRCGERAAGRAHAGGRGHTESIVGAAGVAGDKVDAMTSGRVVLAATPIGNPGDAPDRLRRVLASADVVPAEDTRRLRSLAAALGVSIGGRVMSFYEHNETGRVPQLLDRVRAGDEVAVVTDAGMPAVSDPGYSLVVACIEAGLPVTCLPGPSAVTTALVLSGLPVDRFCFDGFPPRRGGRRRTWLARLATEERTCVFFESPHRLADTLAEAAQVLGLDRRA